VKWLLSLIALVPLAAGTAFAQALPDGAAACLDAFDAALAAGSTEDDEVPTLGTVCTDFHIALMDSAWGEILDRVAASSTDRAGLEALIALERRYESPPARQIATAPLAAIVDDLKPFVPDEKPSLWDRFVDWFNGLFESESGDGNWLSDWLNSFAFSDNAFDAIVRIIAFAAVLAVLGILLNELRLGGAFVRARRSGRRLVSAIGMPASDAPIELNDVLRASDVRRKIELMFLLVVGRLQRHHGDTLHAGRTHGELVRSADELGPELQRPFTDVVRAAERVTYAAWQPDADELGQVIESGRTVVASTDGTTEASQ